MPIKSDPDAPDLAIGFDDGITERLAEEARFVDRHLAERCWLCLIR